MKLDNFCYKEYKVKRIVVEEEVFSNINFGKVGGKNLLRGKKQRQEKVEKSVLFLNISGRKFLGLDIVEQS